MISIQSITNDSVCISRHVQHVVKHKAELLGLIPNIVEPGVTEGAKCCDKRNARVHSILRGRLTTEQAEVIGA